MQFSRNAKENIQKGTIQANYVCNNNEKALIYYLRIRKIFAQIKLTRKML